MLFSSITFWIFFTILLTLLGVFQRTELRKILLLAASYIFYMWWNPAFIILIVFSTTLDYFIGGRIEKESNKNRRKLLLSISIAANLGLLAIFKYANFFQDNLLFVSRIFGYTPTWTELNIILPVGISFYTFQTMSYTIDIYRNELSATKSPLDFALFVSFFPQLVAGPIVRAVDFLPQIHRFKLNISSAAAFLILRGLAKKVLIADNIALMSDTVFDSPDKWPSLIIWLAAICFYIQIYCDFSGYSDMAIGIAKVLGFELPLNFDRPYFAGDPSTFWRKWHISLSSWLRDYLYIPLGGNREGEFQTQKNLMLTMLLGGLWHGASWNFVLWGLLHGLLLILHRLYRQIMHKTNLEYLRTYWAYRIFSIVVFQLFVLIAWVPFRVSDTGDMLISLRKLLFFDFNFQLVYLGLGNLLFISTMLIIVAFFIVHIISHLIGGLDKRLGESPIWVSSIACFVFGLILLLFWPSVETPFIYFQF